LMSNVQETKFGYILTKESARDLSDSVFNLFLTSRNLKSAGDRLMNGQPTAANTDTKKSARYRDL